jgi:hypothetical protein
MKYTCNWFTDLQLDALTIPPDNPLEDVVDGSKYYAKTSSLKEYYPQAADDSICIGLDKTDLPKVPSDNLKKPRNALEGYPSLKTMKETYLNNGEIKVHNLIAFLNTPLNNIRHLSPLLFS